ncbi:hypothetical protein ACFL0Q_05740 [Thermodesulfobacteriota bacterium]
MRKALTYVLIFILVGCTNKGLIITKSNNKIIKPQYSIVIPPEQGWSIYRDDDNPDAAVFQKSINSGLCSMRFSTNRAGHESMKTWTAKQLADAYRNTEKQNMINMGVMTGQHELKDVEYTTETIKGKTYYIMNYVTLHKKHKQHNYKQKSSLYLHFPQERTIRDFILALYSELYPVNEPLANSPRNEFMTTLKSLEVRQ